MFTRRRLLVITDAHQQERINWGHTFWGTETNTNPNNSFQTFRLIFTQILTKAVQLRYLSWISLQNSPADTCRYCKEACRSAFHRQFYTASHYRLLVTIATHLFLVTVSHHYKHTVHPQGFYAQYGYGDYRCLVSFKVIYFMERKRCSMVFWRITETITYLKDCWCIT